MGSESCRYIIIGGNYFQAYSGTGTFTDLSVVGEGNTKEEIRAVIDEIYDKCGGLVLVLDRQTGREADL